MSSPSEKWTPNGSRSLVQSARVSTVVSGIFSVDLQYVCIFMLYDRSEIDRRYGRSRRGNAAKDHGC